MMHSVSRFLFLALLPLALSCSPSGETGLEGVVLSGDRPLAGAEVEVYLREEKDRSTSPFSVAVTDAEGRYRLLLPPGRYFLIGKKKDEDGGRPRMLMAECPANPLEVVRGMKRVPPFSLTEMGMAEALTPDPGTAVEGRVTAAGRPAAGAWVYVYTDPVPGLMGPSYGAAAQADADGRFRIELPAGSYYLAARKRSGGSRLGEPAAGDLNGIYPGNPVPVPRGETVRLKDLPLEPVDAGLRQERLERGKFESTGTAFTGRVVDQDGRPVAGVYAFAYRDSRMVGKPSFISAPSREDGVFTLYLTAAGTYYIGARSAFGGPLEPGEYVGTFEGRADHGAQIRQGQTLNLGDLVVREVW